ncbi:MAG: ATP-binding protein [Janthinobacterium lividum]
MSTPRTSLPLFKVVPWLAIATMASLPPVLYHYLTHNISAERLVVGNRFMALATVLVVVLLSIALIFGNPGSERTTRTARSRRLAEGAAGAALCLSVGILGSIALYGSDRISPWLTHIVFDLPQRAAGQASTATAVSLAFLSCAQCLRLALWQRASCCITLLPLFISGSAILGHAYGVRDLYVLWGRSAIALHSSSALFALSLATLLGQAELCWFSPLVWSGPGGTTARRLFVFTLAIPLIGLFLMQRASAGFMDFGMALAMLVIVTVAPMTGLILHIGATQDRLDDEHRETGRAQTAFAEDLKARLAEQADSLRHESEERIKAESAMYRSQRMEAVGQLTGGIAHDFNNLLMAISASHYILRQHIVPGHPAHQHLLNASAAANRGEKLTSQLLTFSRTQKLDIQSTDLSAVMDFTLAMVGNTLGPSIKVQCELHAQALYVLADANQLEMALLNLALNARDAMPDSGTFTLATSLEVVAAGQGVERYIVISVSDTGIGMSADVAARAVEPFFTTKLQGQGTGLGLAQVYGFVKQCGGVFRLQSRPGQGTTIDMVLPEAQPPEQKKKPVVATYQADSIVTPRSIVLIDDDENVRTALAALLRDAGYVVAEAKDGYAGLELLKTIRPAAVIIDFVMPGLNGADTARMARLDMPGLPIIFVSGYSDTLALDRISDAVVLRKPVDIDQLLGAVETAVCS